MKRSNRKYRTFLSLVVWLFLVQGCSPGKFIAEGESLYKGSRVELDGPETPLKEQKISDDIQSILLPKANKKFLGMFYLKIWLHEKVDPKPGKDRGLKYWLKNKVAEPPVLIAEADTALMSQLIQKKMQDNGFFHAKVDPEIRAVKKRQAVVHYVVQHQQPAQIESFQLPSGETGVDSLIGLWKKFHVKEGNYYLLDDFKKDRLALTEHIRNNGYFEFDEQNLLFLVDTARSSGNLSVALRVKPPRQDSLYKKFYIGDVHVFTTYNADLPEDSLAYRRNFTYKGIQISQNYEFMGRKALSKILLIEKDRAFSLKDYNATVSRLINTDVFRYVNINYRKREANKLDVDIFLTPAKYQGIKFDVEASTSNRSFLGSSVSASYNNKNLFRGGENFILKASAGTEFQFINEKAALNILNLNFEARLDVPGLVTPFKTKKIRSSNMPKTYLKGEENFQKWLQYYTLNSLKFGAGYQWQGKEKFNHHLELLSMEWVTLISKTNAFDELLGSNPLLKTSFKTSMILGRSYSFNVTSQRDEFQRSYVYYSGTVESAGNIAYLAGRIIHPSNDKPYKVLKVPFANYTKIDNEVRHFWDIQPGMSLVSRINVGMGFAFGNSKVLPYVRQVSMGGATTIRAFEFSSVGPGSYMPDPEAAPNPIERSGDLKLLMNLEYRFTMYKFFKGAFFVDAGNVWLRKADPERPGGEFAFNRFYQEIALGTGAGIRLDFDFFALRVDLGIPFYKPNNADGERWIQQFPEQGFKDWRKANWAWNIAIGYPF